MPVPAEFRRLHFDQMRDLPESFGAKTTDNDDVLRAFEGAVFLAVFDDSGRQFGTNSWQRLQLQDGCRVEVDAVIRLLAGDDGNAKELDGNE